MCNYNECECRKAIAKESEKAFENGQEPKGYCPQCPNCEAKCMKRRN